MDYITWRILAFHNDDGVKTYHVHRWFVLWSGKTFCHEIALLLFSFNMLKCDIIVLAKLVYQNQGDAMMLL